MLHGFLNVSDREVREFLRRIIDILDLETGHGHRLGELIERGLGFEVVFQPGKGKFHDRLPPSLGKLDISTQ